MKTVFINPERCIGCLQCELACAVEHSQSKDETLAFLETPVPRKRVHVQAGPIPTFAFPNRCRHCDPAPCLQVCPTGAIYRDDEHGLVLVDEQKCIGCAMCAVVCPFDVLTFHPLAEGPDARGGRRREVRRVRRAGRPGRDPGLCGGVQGRRARLRRAERPGRRGPGARDRSGPGGEPAPLPPCRRAETPRRPGTRGVRPNGGGERGRHRGPSRRPDGGRNGSHGQTVTPGARPRSKSTNEGGPR